MPLTKITDTKVKCPVCGLKGTITSDDTTSFNHTDTIYFYSDKTKGL